MKLIGGILSLVFIFLVWFSVQVCTLDVDADRIKNDWIPKFQNNIHVFAEQVLRADEIKKTMDNNLQKNRIKILDPNEEFSRVHRKISVRLSDVHAALMGFKKAIEDELGHEHFGVPLPMCCQKNVSDYIGRLRQKADMGSVCVGTRKKDPFSVKVRDAFQELKNNYMSNSAILWQYFSTVNGHFVQYPTSRRHCDSAGNLVSPLTEEWFVEKLFMKRKNLVILIDVGDSTKRPAEEISPMSVLHWITEAVVRTLDTLTSEDKINVVAFNSTVITPDSCHAGLFTASQRNLDQIQQFVHRFKHPSGGSDLQKGLETAYRMLLTERNKDGRQNGEMDSIVMVITAGNLTNIDQKQLYSSIADYQTKLDNKVLHYVYFLNTPVKGGDVQNDAVSLNVLQNLANQRHPEWPMGVNMTGITTPVGPDGYFTDFDSIKGFVDHVATYYTKISPLSINSASVIAPIRDPHSGLVMTSTIPVQYSTLNGVYGVAAIDSSMAAMFAEVVNFDIGVHSYMFVLENVHGHVLFHPKLMDPSEALYEDSVFPPLSVIEPSLDQKQCQEILTGTGKTFKAKMRPGRTSFMSGLEAAGDPQDVTIVYQRVRNTPFVVVLVWFPTDRDLQIPKHLNQDVTLHAPYHRLDQIHLSPSSNKPKDSDVCSHDNRYTAPTESVIKLAPTVFKDPESYKYNNENIAQIMELNSFLEQSKNTSLIRPEIQDEIRHFIMATNNVDFLWRPASHNVLQRFLGTPTGVLRFLPGMPLENTYNHMHQQWFKRSSRLQGKLIFTRGFVSKISDGEAVLMSNGVSQYIPLDNTTGTIQELQAVVGAALTYRQLTAMLYDVSLCNQGDIQCHLLDMEGYLLTYGDDVGGKYSDHITHRYPWLANRLIKQNLMKPVWCTSLSEGNHQLTYSLALTFDQDESKSSPCRRYTLGSVAETNLFVLVLLNRSKNSCSETNSQDAMCENSNVPPGNRFKCGHCVDELQQCERPCSCESDMDPCSGEFTHANMTWFPNTECFYHPSLTTPTQTGLRPNSPPVQVPLCQVPCIVRETKQDCMSLEYCRWREEDSLPICEQRNDPTTEASVSSKSSASTTPQVTKAIKTTNNMQPTKTLSTNTPSPTTSEALSTKRSSLNTDTKPNTKAIPSGIANTKATPSGTTYSKTTPSGSTNTKVTPVGEGSSTSMNGLSSLSTTDQTTRDIQKISHPLTKLMSSTTDFTPVVSTNAAVNGVSSGSYTTPSSLSVKSANKGDGGGKGWIAGVVVAILVVVILGGFISFRVYQKKTHGVGRSSNYLPQGRVFDGALFRAGSDNTVLTQASSNNTPYHQIE